MKSDNLERLLVAAVVIPLALCVWLLVREHLADKFSLRKDEWNCTASHQTTATTIVNNNGIPTPITTVMEVCDQWTSRGVGR